MASRKLVRDIFLSKRHPLLLHLTSQQVSGARLRLMPPVSSTNWNNLGYRRFGVFNEFSNKLKEEASRNKEFQETVKELKDKTQEMKGMKKKMESGHEKLQESVKDKAAELKDFKEELKVRTKQTTEQLYKHAGGVWTEVEATAKKVSANVKETISAAKEFKENLHSRKQESTDSTESTSKDGTGVKDDEKKASSGEDEEKQTGTSGNTETFFGKFRSSIPSAKLSSALHKLKEAKITDFVKKGYDVVKEELHGNPSKRKHLEHTPSPSFNGERSARTDIVVLPAKQSRWNKKWEAFRQKMQGNPLFKRFVGISEPVVTKGQEIAEDMRERWETSDNPIVHKIQDVSDTVFQETDAAASIKEIRRRDPSFSMMDFVAEVQEAVKPVLNAYIKGDLESLKKYCTSEVITRCEAEHKAFQSHGIFFDNKILHISDVEVRETKMMGTSPIIIVAFQTQQVHCVRDRDGKITEGGQDTIHTVYYAWAMQQIDPEELGEGAIYPVWKLREVQQLGIQALI